MDTNYYNIGEVSKMFNLPISTLHYYDREGLFPNLNRSESGARRFDDGTVEFMMWCQQGPATYGKRKEMFAKQKETVEAEIEHLKKVLDMINFKCWYYDTAIADGNEDRLKNLSPDDMPPEIKVAWINAHT